MLSALSIRDVVLIDRLDLSFKRGLSVLTGETGAGKSILLDALGLALGARADSGLVRSDASQATVTATFEFQDLEPVRKVLEEVGLDPDAVREGLLLLRRVVSADGRSRAFVDDQPVSVGTLRRLGDALVEIQGQFDAHGLLDPASHRQFLDDFAKHDALLGQVAEAFSDWTEARDGYERAREDAEQAREQEDHLRHAVEELNHLDPRPGEAAELAATRDILANAGQVIEGMSQAQEAVSGDDGAEARVAMAQRLLDRVADRAGDRLAGVLAALDRAAAELQEADSTLSTLAQDIEADSTRLEEIDDRLHALRGVARKHGVEPDDLANLRDDLSGRLEAINGGGGALAGLKEAMVEAEKRYLALAERLSASRVEAGGRLDGEVMAELPPLRLEKARFTTTLERQDQSHWSEHGVDRVAFQVSTNPGTPFGALNRIASGGELSRFLLALRVALAAANPLPTLIFDEVDAGVGGAVAAAVGERLQKLGARLQVLVVTHSPQVAAKGAAHWRIAKNGDGARMATTATPLDAAERQEEIARMLAGEVITKEARAAAASLLQASNGA